MRPLIEKFVTICISATTSIVLAMNLAPLAYGDTESPWGGSSSAACGAHNQMVTGAVSWAAPQPLSDENAVGGVVRDLTGSPVADALVVVLGVGATRTDSNGAFQIRVPASLTGVSQFTAIVRKDGVSLPASIALARGIEVPIEATSVNGDGAAPRLCNERSLVAPLLSITQLATQLRQHVMKEFTELTGSADVSIRSISDRTLEQLNTVLFGAAAFPTRALVCPRREALCTLDSLRGRKRILRSAVTSLRAEALLANRALVERARRSENDSARAKRRAPFAILGG